MYRYTDKLANELYKKLNNVEIKAEGSDFKVKATVEKEDRDGDIVRVKGLDTKAYEKNPVVLANHDGVIENIIGKATKITKTEDSLEIEGKFANTELATIAKKLYEDGFLNAVSIGFKPKEMKDNNSIDGMDITKSELLELSFVGVGANRDALSINQNDYNLAIQKGLITENDGKDFILFDKQISIGEEDKNVKYDNQKQEKQVSLNTINFEGVERTNWSNVDKSLSAFIGGYYQNSDVTPPDETPTQASDLSQQAKRWIASKTMIGNENATTADELINLPVVNPITNRLNKAGLQAVKQFAPQVEGITEDEAETIQNKVDDLLASNFEEENSLSEAIGKVLERQDIIEEKFDKISEDIQKLEDGNSSKDDDFYSVKENAQVAYRALNEALRDMKDK